MLPGIQFLPSLVFGINEGTFVGVAHGISTAALPTKRIDRTGLFFIQRVPEIFYPQAKTVSDSIIFEGQNKFLDEQALLAIAKSLRFFGEIYFYI